MISRWVVGGSLALALLFGIGFWAEREARQRATHGIVADSLARNTRQSTDALTSYVDTVYLPSRARLTSALDRVDTLTLPPEARDLVRECRAFVLTCEGRAARSDSVIRDLRAELGHAKNPPPKKRLGYFAETGYSVLDGGAVVGVGATVRLIGKVSLLGKIEGASKGSEWKERPDTKAVVGLRITF